MKLQRLLTKLLFTLFITISTTTYAQIEQEDISRYLAGAVPVINGEVIFSDTTYFNNINKDEIYKLSGEWLKGYLAGFKNEKCRLAFSKAEDCHNVGLLERYIIFKQSALVLDRATMNCVIQTYAQDNRAIITVSKIKYVYDEQGLISRMSAEEYITDKDGLNKNKTKLSFGFGKFRRKTIDAVDEIFASFKDYVSKLQTINISVATATPVNNNIVISATPLTPANKTTEKSKEEAIKSNRESQLLANGYKKITIDNNIADLIAADGLVAITNSNNKIVATEVSNGGVGENTIIIKGDKDLNLSNLIDNNPYTITLYTPLYANKIKSLYNRQLTIEEAKESGFTPIETESGAITFKEAWLVIECTKEDIMLLNNTQMVICKISNIWAK